MRILIPLLLLAGLGVGYFALRGGSDTDTTGTGPKGSTETTAAPREPLVLDRGQPAGRSAAADPAVVPQVGGAAAPIAVDSASANAEPVQEPDLTGGFTNDPVGTQAGLASNAFYVEKYRDSSRAVRVQAYDALRQAVDIEFARSEKGSAELAAEMKREMEWLQEHFEPDAP